MSDNDALVVPLPGEWDLGRKEELEELLRPAYNRPRVVVDFSETRYIDSTTLGLLIAMRKSRVDLRGFEPAHFVVPENHIAKLLRLVGFDSIFPTYESLQEAVSDFPSTRPYRDPETETG